MHLSLLVVCWYWVLRVHQLLPQGCEGTKVDLDGWGGVRPYKWIWTIHRCRGMSQIHGYRGHVESADQAAGRCTFVWTPWDTHFPREPAAEAFFLCTWRDGLFYAHQCPHNCLSVGCRVMWMKTQIRICVSSLAMHCRMKPCTHCPPSLGSLSPMTLRIQWLYHVFFAGRLSLRSCIYQTQHKM